MKSQAAKPTQASLLSPERAFVLQLYPEVDVSQGVFVGRVEHAESGQSVRFASLEALVAFLGQVLAGKQPGSPP